jgi:hypothetical protein
MKLSIEHQGSGERTGKRIVIYENDEVIGRTGYLSYPHTNGKRTATLGVLVTDEKRDAVYGLLVRNKYKKNEYRKKGLGKLLLTKLIQEVKKDFDELKIPHISENVEDFYKKVLQKLKKTGKIRDYSVDTIYNDTYDGHESKCSDYKIIL